MKKKITKIKRQNIPKQKDSLFKAIVSLIERSKQRTFVTVNKELVTLYWNIGKLLLNKILKNKRADYGGQIIATLSQLLAEQYGRGFTYTAL